MKKGESTITPFLIAGVIAVLILVIVLASPKIREVIIDKISIIIPNFNATKNPISEEQLLRYDIKENTVEWYNGKDWIEFKDKGFVELGEVRIDWGKNRYYFENYFYRGSRDNNLSTIRTYPESRINGISGPIENPKEDNGAIFIDFNKDRTVFDGKMFLITRAKIYSGDQFYFRYNNEWEWSHTSQISKEWKKISQEVLKEDYWYGQGVSSSNQLIPIIKNLVNKDFNSGLIVLLSGDENYNFDNPANNIFTVGFPGPNLEPGGINLYFRYGNGWQWSENKNQWKNVAEFNSHANPMATARLINLIGKNFDEGIQYLFITKDDSSAQQFPTGQFILRLDETLYFKELKNNNYQERTLANSLQVFSSISLLIIPRARSWRDSVFAKPIEIKDLKNAKDSNDLGTKYYCPKYFRGTYLMDKRYIVIDLGKEADSARC